MKIRRSRSFAAAIVTGLMFLGVTAFAQTETSPQAAPQQGQTALKTDISDARLKKFVEVYKKTVPQQQQAQTQMVKAIEDEGLKPERFQEIMVARQQNDAKNANASADEMKKFNNAGQKIVAIQNEVEPAIEKTITDSGMKPEEFQQIAMAYQQSPEIQQRVQALMKQP